MRKIYSLLLLGGLLFFGVSNAWAGANFYEAYFTYSYNGTTADRTCGSASTVSNALGTLTADFKITSIYLKYWKDGSGNMCGGLVDYYINSDKEYQPTWDYVHKSGNDWELQSEAEWTIAKYNEGNSGNYTFYYRFKTWGSTTSSSECGTNFTVPYGSDKNYFTYTIAPPNVTGFSVSHSDDDVVAGSGTAADPYIIKNNGSLKLTVAGAKARVDENSALLVKFGADDASETKTKTISEITSTDVQSIVVQSYCYNSTASVSSASTEETTIYYKAGYDVAVTGAGWASLYLPYNAEVPAGATAYYASNVDGATITLTPVPVTGSKHIILQNQGVLIQADENTYTFHHSNVVSPASYTSLFGGVTAATEVSSIFVEGKTVYVLGKDNESHLGFYPFTGTLSAYKAYLQITTVTTAPGAPGMRFVIEDENQATNIDAIEAVEEGVKFFQNGILYIKKSGVVYDMMGTIVK